MFRMDTACIGVVGLGYVGLPLAVAFGQQFPTIGFDVNPKRIRELDNGIDNTREVSAEELASAARLTFSDSDTVLQGCNFFVVTVPTPVNDNKLPDLTAVRAASRSIGRHLKMGDVVVYESTVYPGATEEECIPILEQESGLRFNEQFFIGYSPERINPSDRTHRLTDIRKITSGSTPEAAEFIDQIYNRIIRAGTFRAASIRVAEAAKVIENTQRDVNIALINELCQIFHRLDLDTQEVLEAAGTKWNFLPFSPGLVGGHCIGVDPYYLIHKAQVAGHQPVVIPASRTINDGMGEYVAERVIKLMARNGISVVGGRLLVMGLAFKENCPDLRNTRCVDIVDALRGYNARVDVYDPWVDHAEAEAEYGIRPLVEPQPGAYDAIIVAVAHDLFRKMGIEKIRALGRTPSILFDVKYLFPAAVADGRL